jgi:hypothetical protein
LKRNSPANVASAAVAPGWCRSRSVARRTARSSARRRFAAFAELIEHVGDRVEEIELFPSAAGTDGLPLGVQLVGPRDGDARLLRTARWLAAAVAAG